MISLRGSLPPCSLQLLASSSFPKKHPLEHMTPADSMHVSSLLPAMAGKQYSTNQICQRHSSSATLPVQSTGNMNAAQSVLAMAATAIASGRLPVLVYRATAVLGPHQQGQLWHLECEAKDTACVCETGSLILPSPCLPCLHILLIFLNSSLCPSVLPAIFPPCIQGLSYL